jgi:hypothetical protein
MAESKMAAKIEDLKGRVEDLDREDTAQMMIFAASGSDAAKEKAQRARNAAKKLQADIADLEKQRAEE